MDASAAADLLTSARRVEGELLPRIERERGETLERPLTTPLPPPPPPPLDQRPPSRPSANDEGRSGSRRGSRREELKRSG